MQQFFQLLEEIEIRTISRVRQCFPPVIGKNSPNSSCDVMSCIVTKQAVTFLFCNTSVKTLCMDDFSIPDSIAISSHITIVAVDVLSVDSMPRLQYCPDLDEPFGTNMKLCHDLMLSHHKPPTRIHTFTSARDCVKFQF